VDPDRRELAAAVAADGKAKGQRVVDVLGARIVDGDGGERGAVEPRVRAQLRHRQQPPRLGRRVAARLDAEVELARLQLGWVLADVAEQLHEAALHAAVLQLHLGEPVALAPAWRTEWAATQVVVGWSGLRRTLSRVWPPSCG